MFVRLDLRTLRVLRLLRLARLVKLGRYSTALGTFTSVIRNKKEQLVVSSTAIYYLEHDHQPAIISVISIGMVAFPSGIIVAGFEEAVDHREEDSTPQLCPHCGESIEIRT